MKRVFVGLSLAALAATLSAKEAVLFLNAHPDDTDGFAGTAYLLKDRYDVHVVDLTRGELGLGWTGLRDGSTAYRRTQEETKAQAYYGATIHFLSEVDGSAAAGDRPASDLAKLLLEIKPRAVFTHWPVDAHADHVQCPAVLVNALRKSGLKPERYFFEEWMRQTRNMVPTYYVDISAVFKHKLAILSCYECQNKDGSLLKMTEKRARWRGRQRVPAVAFAEPFTTWDGRPIKGGVLESLSETAVAPGAESVRIETENDVTLPAASPADVPVCTAEVCPERADDCVWENDKFGMRAYGPGDYHKWSGFDVFSKKGSGSAAWMMHHPGDCGRWHDVPWQGVLDNYTMGPSRGVGGIAMFADGEWKTYPNWVSFREIHRGADFCEFEIVYPAFSAAGRMTCHITLRRGERFFRNDVSFERMPKDFVVGPGMDLEPKRDHKGDLVEEEGLVSLFEDAKGANGSTMSAVFTAPGEKVEMLTDPNNSRIIGIRGKKSFTCWAGASWSQAGEITTPEAWHAEVRRYRGAM